jgi:hypothetical protein
MVRVVTVKVKNAAKLITTVLEYQFPHSRGMKLKVKKKTLQVAE